jgi:hypothetical protein
MIVRRDEVRRIEKEEKRERIFMLISAVIGLTAGYEILGFLLCAPFFDKYYYRYAKDYLLLVCLSAFIASLLPAVGYPIVDRLGLRDDWVMVIWGVGFLFFLFVLVSVPFMGQYNYIPSWLPWL